MARSDRDGRRYNPKVIEAKKERLGGDKPSIGDLAGGGENGDIPTATVDELQGGLLSVDDIARMLDENGPFDSDGPVRKDIPSRLFVGGLAPTVTTPVLRTTFEAIGPVADAIVVLDRDTGDSRGFGFVTMERREDATTAIERLNGQELEGRVLVVRSATERRETRTE